MVLNAEEKMNKVLNAETQRRRDAGRKKMIASQAQQSNYPSQWGPGGPIENGFFLRSELARNLKTSFLSPASLRLCVSAFKSYTHITSLHSSPTSAFRLSTLIFSFIVFLLFNISPLKAEIELVTVFWTPALCPSCGPLISKAFSKMPGVDHFTVDAGVGVAKLYWKPKHRFTYEEVDYGLRMIGIAIRDIYVKASGKLGTSKLDFFLISDGDKTRFDLVNPITPDITRQTPLYNLAARTISPYLQKKLLKGDEEGRTITIEGPLFMPWRHYTHPQLVVDQLDFSDVKRD